MKKREKKYILLFVKKFGCVNMQVHTPVLHTNRCGIPTCNTHRHVVLTIVLYPPAGVTHSYIGNAFNAFK